MKLMAPLLLIAATITWAQEFSLPTPKGNVVLKVTRIRFDPLLHQYNVQGTISNASDTDFANLMFKVAFYDAKDQELTTLCGSGNAVRTCTLSCPHPGGFPAHQTIALEPITSFIRVNFPNRNGGPQTIGGGTPKIGKFKLSLLEAFVGVRYQIALLKPAPNGDLSFDDSLLAFHFHLDVSDGIGFEITNKTDVAASINWSTVSYIDAAGEAHKVVHAGVKFSEKNVPLVPTVIPPTARITESVFPVDRIYTISGIANSGWSKAPLLPVSVNLFQSSPASAAALVDSSRHLGIQNLEGAPFSLSSGPDVDHLKYLEGSTFSLFMPIEVQGKSKDYSFVFKVMKVEF